MTWRCIKTFNPSKFKHEDACLFFHKKYKYPMLLSLFRFDEEYIKACEKRDGYSYGEPRDDWDDINGDTESLDQFSHWMPINKPKKK